MTVELHVEQAGTGRALVLLHAFPLSGAMWVQQQEALADGWRVLAPDLRGFGRSSQGSDEPSLDHMADDVAAMLDRLRLDRVVLGGLSMGGYVTMALLRRHPHRVRAVVLADTKATADPPPAREKRQRIAARLDEERTPAALIEEVLPTLCGPTTAQQRPAVGEQVAGMVRNADPAAAAWAQRAMAARPDSTATLGSVDVPSLVVRGQEDELSTPADADLMVDAVPDARLVVLAGSGHLTALEVPNDFTNALRAFLSQVG